MVLTCSNINEVDVAVVAENAKIFQNTKVGEFAHQRYRKQDKDNYSN